MIGVLLAIACYLWRALYGDSFFPYAHLMTADFFGIVAFELQDSL